MLINFLVRQSHPWNGWIRLFLALCLPAVVYTQSTMWIIGLIGVSLILVFLFPKPTEKIKTEFFYHAVRGMYLELKGKASFNSPLWKMLSEGIVMKVIFYIGMLLAFIFSIYLLWNGELMRGSFIYYFLITLKMLLLSEYSNISQILLVDDEWDTTVSFKKE